MIRGLLILALCVCYSRGTVSAQDATSYGQVIGSVVFANGKPAPGMMIILEQIDSQFSIRSITDQYGHYSIPNLPIGDYVIYPFGIDDQYPLRHDMFLAEHPDRFRINVEGAWVTENLVMPSEAAIFSGTIVNGQGNAIPDAQIVFCHADQVWRSAEIHSDASGQFRYVVPSGENLSVFCPCAKA